MKASEQQVSLTKKELKALIQRDGKLSKEEIALLTPEQKEERKAFKSQKPKAKEEKLKDRNLEVVKEKVKEKQKQSGKFKGIDYDNAPKNVQKSHRDKVRLQMFKIIDPYHLAKKAKKAEMKTKTMETFKAFMNEEYDSSKVSEIESLYRGQGEQKEIFDTFVQEFKAYLAQ